MEPFISGLLIVGGGIIVFMVIYVIGCYIVNMCRINSNKEEVKYEEMK